MKIDQVKAKCLEIECPHYGKTKIDFKSLDFEQYWDRRYGYELTITFKCPACGEEHEILKEIM